MKMVIHDLKDEEFKILFPDTNQGDLIVSGTHEIRKCTGCFACWIKTPGSCVINDSYSELGCSLSMCDELVIISRCYYGGYSPFVKNVIDRMIGFMLPFFTLRDDELHHQSRYLQKVILKVFFYGDDLSDSEKKTASKMVKAHCLSFNFSDSLVHFYAGQKDMGGIVL